MKQPQKTGVGNEATTKDWGEKWSNHKRLGLGDPKGWGGVGYGGVEWGDPKGYTPMGWWDDEEGPLYTMVLQTLHALRDQVTV